MLLSKTGYKPVVCLSRLLGKRGDDASVLLSGGANLGISEVRAASAALWISIVYITFPFQQSYCIRPRDHIRRTEYNSDHVQSPG